MKNRKWLAIALTVLLLFALLAGCAKKEGSMSEWNDSMGGNYAPGTADKPGDSLYDKEGITQSGAVENRKLIRTIRMDAETEGLDTLLAQLDARIAQLGGYVEDREVYNGSAHSYGRSRYANMTIRIPVAQLDAFVTHVTDASNVISSSETAEDVTLSYIATQSRITALETEEARLLELLAKAGSLNDLLTIESRLTEVRTELEKVTSQLRLYDNLVDYGTIRLYLQEVKTYTVVEEEEPTMWDRIADGFMESLQNLGTLLKELLIVFVSSLPYLALIGVIVLVIVACAKLSQRKKAKNAGKEPPEKEENL